MTMKRIIAIIVPAVALANFCMIKAGEKNDPAADAVTIAPYIDEQTFSVVHIDVAGVKIDSGMDMLSRLMPEEKEGLAEGKVILQELRDSFIKAGGRDIYLLIRVDMRDPVLFVVPVGEKFDQEPIEHSPAFKMIFKDFTFKRVGGEYLGALANPQGSVRLDKITPNPRPELAAAFESVGSSPIQVLLLPPNYFRRVIGETIPQLPREYGGGSTNIITKGFSWAALGIDFAPQIAARLVIQSTDAASAAALSAMWGDVLKHVAELPKIKKSFPSFADAVPAATPKAEGDKLVLKIDESNIELVSLLGKIEAALVSEGSHNAQRAQSINNMKQIGLAMHNYYDANKHFPAAAIYSKDGKPLLSWRVAILPMLDQSKLYDQFHLDEPWNSEHNKKLIDKMPDVYRSPRSKLKTPGMTNYEVPVGPGTMFDRPEGKRIKDITHGTAHTIMAVEVDDAHAVAWTKPEDLPYNPKEPAKGLGGLFEGCFVALYCDGHIEVIKLPCSDETLRAAFSAGAGDLAPNFD
jgi:hypothetical protein